MKLQFLEYGVFLFSLKAKQELVRFERIDYTALRYWRIQEHKTKSIFSQ